VPGKRAYRTSGSGTNLSGKRTYQDLRRIFGDEIQSMNYLPLCVFYVVADVRLCISRPMYTISVSILFFLGHRLSPLSVWIGSRTDNDNVHGG